MIGKWIGLLAGVLLVPVLALATMAIPPFEVVDRNADGVVDREEFHAAFPEAGPRAFETIAGPDGLITSDEWKEFREMHKTGERMYGPDFHERND
jgi:hypothetical protein